MSNGMFTRKFLIVSLLITSLFITFLPVSEGAEEIFPLAKIKPGMTGHGYTVFIGTKIEKFDFKVLALIDGEDEQTKLILVRLSGKLMKKNGGLATGMSGSPLYIGRKLIGAVSYGFENADPLLALATPIQAMLGLFNNDAKTRAARIDLHNYRTCAHLKPVPVVTPVLVSGMGSRGYEMISRLLEKNGLKAIAWPGARVRASENHKMEIATQTAIKPGSAISVQMISGDFQVSAIGTVTYVDHGNFLAFGHPFTNKGNVDYLAFQAYIFQTVKSPEISFKLGSPLKVMGRITQDRQAGILGRLGETPDLITVNVNVKDEERDLKRFSSFQVITNEQIYPDLIISGVTDAIDKAIDRVGNGTATVAVRIETAEWAPAITETNVFYGKDIAVSCLHGLEDLLNVLASNEFSKTTVKTVKVDIEVQNKQVSARILQLISDNQKVDPGETFTVNARMHTYRGDDFEVPLRVKLPDNIEPGKLVLNISGGSKQYLEDTGEENQKKENAKAYHRVRSISELITRYTSAPKNNELVLEYLPVYSEADQKSQTEAAEKEDRNKPIRIKHQTNYYIFGEAQLTVDVIKPTP